MDLIPVMRCFTEILDSVLNYLQSEKCILPFCSKRVLNGCEFFGIGSRLSGSSLFVSVRLFARTVVSSVVMSSHFPLMQSQTHEIHLV